MNINRIAEIINNNYETEIKTITKGGIEKQGIVIKIGNICPIFYPDNYEGTNEEVAMEIITAINNIDMPKLNTVMFNDYEHIKDNLKLGIRPVTDGNDAVVTWFWLDLELYLYVDFGNGMTTKITKDILKAMGVSADDAYKDAIENILDSAKIESMKEILNEMGMDIPDGSPDQIVLTNTGRYLGASVIVLNPVVRKAAQMMHCDKIAILPSSIHELIIVPYTDNSEELNQMVQDVNRTTVDPEERLADHIYVFDVNTNEIEIH